jgi:superfamily I DNA/RNA helicase
LEFDHVFIAGCESGLIPYTLFRKDVNLIEEQNLLYVGMTRAKKQLTITYAERRNINGMIKTTGKSHLLELINKSYLEYIREKPAEKNSKNNQLDLF